MVLHTLEAFVVETDLAKELLLGTTEVGCDSLPSDDGKRGVPGGVRSLRTWLMVSSAIYGCYNSNNVI